MKKLTLALALRQEHYSDIATSTALGLRSMHIALRSGLKLSRPLPLWWAVLVTNIVLAPSSYADTQTPTIFIEDENVREIVEKNYDPNGNEVTSTTTSYQHDADGKVTQITVTSPEGFTKTTTYTNDSNK